MYFELSRLLAHKNLESFFENVNAFLHPPTPTVKALSSSTLQAHPVCAFLARRSQVRRSNYFRTRPPKSFWMENKQKTHCSWFGLFSHSEMHSGRKSHGDLSPRDMSLRYCFHFFFFFSGDEHFLATTNCASCSFKVLNCAWRKAIVAMWTNNLINLAYAELIYTKSAYLFLELRLSHSTHDAWTPSNARCPSAMKMCGRMRCD